MDLVHEYHCLNPHPPAVLSLGHHLLNLLYTAGDRAEINEFSMGFMGYDTCKRGFAHPRRSPEYHGRDLVLLYELAEYLSLSQQMFLPHKPVQVIRPEPACQGIIDLAVIKQ